MASRVLVVDNQNLIRAGVESALEHYNAEPVVVEGLAAAKRKLVQSIPDLIIGLVSFIGDEEGGFRFCSELRQHALFAKIPVILVADELTDAVIRRASEAGAQGILAWPVQVEALKLRLKLFLQQADVPPMPQTAPISKQPLPESPAAPASGGEDKIKLAQNLLARVLHNLKTSDLLRVVEAEDVPRVVFEMTRSVCGFQREAGRDSDLGGDEVDLEKVFDSAKRLKRS